MRLGLDYGGTKIEGIVLGPDGSERARARVPTPRFDYDGGIRAIRGLLEQLEARAGGRIDSVGIGVPGSVDRGTGRVSKGNSTWLHGRDLRGDLTAALDRPVKIANDANCFALSEAVDGAGAGAQVVFGVILGTGVGGGIVVHGRLIEGINAIGGEWGHIPLPTPLDDERPGPFCSCGLAGHTEAWLSGPSFAADFARRKGIRRRRRPQGPGDRRPRRGRRRRRRGDPAPLRGPPRSLAGGDRQHPRPRRHRPRRRPLQRQRASTRPCRR